MKKITLLLSFIACVFVAQAQLILTDNFEYAVGPLLSTTWVGTGATPATTNPIQVTASTITYAGYPGSGVGNEIALITSGEDLNRSFPAAIKTGFIYFSALVNLSAAQATGDYFLHVGDIPAGSSYFARTFAKLDGDKIAFGIVNASGTGSTVTYTASTYNLNTTYLIVVKIDAVTGESSLVVNPTIGATEPTTWLSNKTGATVPPAGGLLTINIRQGTGTNAPTLKMDGLRVATTWADLFKTTNVANTNANTFKAIISGKNLLLQSVQEGASVEIFSALGSRVLSSTVANAKIDISNLSKGLYVVRVGNQTQKILF